MSFIDAIDKAKRVAVRETLGAVVRAKAARADNAGKIAELVALRASNPAPLQPEDFKAVAKDWRLDPRTLHALADAESSGFGFEQPGKVAPHAVGRVVPAIECHVFSCATSGAFDRTHQHLSYPEFIQYVKGAPPPPGMFQHPYAMSYDDRWGLFAMQAELSIEAACCATSLGRFQPLIGRTPYMKRKGQLEGWRPLGFASAEAMFRKLAAGSEVDHLEVLHRYLQAHGLMRAFRELDWHTIARGYNGIANVEVYAAKMATAWKKRGALYA